ncbi:MAG TPA: hypothetical protein VLA88_06660 [Candidatus Saccharimonadales bacterium]|nr:hypothetical protein [Candidatus Saccharimonadales bacterium]
MAVDPQDAWDDMLRRQTAAADSQDATSRALAAAAAQLVERINAYVTRFLDEMWRRYGERLDAAMGAQTGSPMPDQHYFYLPSASSSTSMKLFTGRGVAHWETSTPVGTLHVRSDGVWGVYHPGIGERDGEVCVFGFDGDRRYIFTPHAFRSSTPEQVEQYILNALVAGSRMTWHTP